MSVPPVVKPALYISPAPKPYTTPPNTDINNSWLVSISIIFPIFLVRFTQIGNNREPKMVAFVFS